MAADSATYDDATQQRRYAMAQALLAPRTTPIQSWAQGLDELGKGALGGYQMARLDAEHKAEKATEKGDLYSALGLSAPAAPAAPASGMSRIAALLSGGQPDASAPAVAPPVAAPAPMPSPAGPVPAPPIAPASPSAPPAAVMPSAKVWGDKEAEAAGLYEPRAKVAQALAGGGAAPAPTGGILAGVPDDKKAAIAAMLTSQNPTAKALGMAAITNLTKQDTPISVGGKLVTPQGKVVYDGGDTTPKFGVIGEDAMGRKQYGFANPDKQTVTSIAPQTGASPVPDNLADLHGPEYMAVIKAQDPKLANQVQAIIEGRAPYPTGMLLKTPYGQALAQHVTQADPSFESGNATARVKTRNEFMTGGVGSPAGQITAGNTALQHAGEMSDALERMKEGGGILRGLGNAGLPMVSYAANQMKNKSVQGTPEGAALNDFMTAKNHFSEEVTKFYAGSAGSEAERTRALANLDAAKSLPELRSAIKTEVNLMQGKVNALQDRWKNGMGPLVPEFPLIQPKSQEAIDRVIKRHQSSEQPAAASAPRAAPQPGMMQDGYRFKGGNPADKANWEQVS